jgi:hypothetical protein
MNRIVRLVSLFAILTLIPVWAFGQAESGAINGIVTDKTGAVVEGAEVTATSVDTGLVHTVTTGSTGEYAITNLPPRRDTRLLDCRYCGLMKSFEALVVFGVSFPIS